MDESYRSLLCCPVCTSKPLRLTAVKKNGHTIDVGVLICTTCHMWYPITDGILELLPISLAYKKSRDTFFRTYGRKLKLLPDQTIQIHNTTRQKDQQVHFDWYEKNSTQSYDSYEKTPFWKGVDALTFRSWVPRISQRTLLLDVGCAQGRSAFPFVSKGVRVVGFDVSKSMIKNAIQRAKINKTNPKPFFFVGDATRFPFGNASFDAVVLHGVLHHVVSPSHTAHEISRVLVPGGIFLGLENNKTPLRPLFDLLQRFLPQWFEKAGNDPLIDETMLKRWFLKTPMKLTTISRVFLPPHIINMFSHRTALWFLTKTDELCSNLPIMRNWGGLIDIKGVKQKR